MALAHSPKIVTNGLVLCLDAANVKSYPGSGTTWTDLSKNGNNGTLTNGPTFNSGNGGGIVLDGVNDQISFGNINLSSSSQISIDFWCKILTYPAVDGSGALLLEISTNFNNSTEGLYIGIGDDSTPSFNDTFPISLNIKGNVGYNIHGYDKVSVNDLKWHHWCCMFDKSVSGTNPVESRLFIDGVEKSVTTFVDPSLRQNNTNNFGNQPLYIGCRSNGASPSNFQISNLKIYTRLISAQEIQQNFNAQRGRFGV